MNTYMATDIRRWGSPLSRQRGGWGICKHFVSTLSTPWQDSIAQLKSIGQQWKIFFENTTMRLLHIDLEKMLTAEPIFMGFPLHQCNVSAESTSLSELAV